MTKRRRGLRLFLFFPRTSSALTKFFPQFEMKMSKKTPWLDDKLERNISAEFLSKYLCGRYEKRKNDHGAETIVFALNSDWGFGKTYFLRNWKLELESLDYPVVYFDAWENDYTSDPLVGFIAEVDKALKPRFKSIPVATRLLKTTINSAKKNDSAGYRRACRYSREKIN